MNGLYGTNTDRDNGLMDPIERIRDALAASRLTFKELELISNVEVTFSVYSGGRLRVALFVDECLDCPLHGRKNKSSTWPAERNYGNRKLVGLGVNVIRAWACTSRIAPYHVVARVEFALARSSSWQAYCSVLEPKGLGTRG